MTFFLRTGGSRSRRCTSGGSDKGASPIRDAHLGVVVNDRVLYMGDSAGMRKSGTIECCRRKA